MLMLPTERQHFKWLSHEKSFHVKVRQNGSLSSKLLFIDFCLHSLTKSIWATILFTLAWK